MSDFKRSEIEPKVWIREPQDFCLACGDDRTGKGSLIAAPLGQAFCNELCLMKWQQSRIAELEAQNDDYQIRLARYRRGLEHIGNVPDWETALEYAHAALIHDIHDGFGKFYFEQLEAQNALLRAVAEAARGYVNENWDPLKTMTQESLEANLIRLLQKAIDGGAITERLSD